ncbi:hypothetical protein ASPSYDRAFT_74142 [Aspergillus sydowii CBS 593.65]|uniref:Uncharacterized protein n=1 Tax=Aspergillus sydowii CBS 593.65 TaxID=1036612 RepID=A0A1L9SXD4_9EURO|nr:uncharacterized protein ASPSYDRAFT_74142 [Aspergillus sydowii CBS 593.65]OJJ51862.1 hypothetical protein ASPSYDRAFT_74142 [Aspergillus sydowii CBS 593.65]
METAPLDKENAVKQPVATANSAGYRSDHPSPGKITSGIQEHENGLSGKGNSNVVNGLPKPPGLLARGPTQGVETDASRQPSKGYEKYGYVKEQHLNGLHLHLIWSSRWDC